MRQVLRKTPTLIETPPRREKTVQRFLTFLVFALFMLIQSAPIFAVTPEEFLALKVTPEDRRAVMPSPRHKVQEINGKPQTLKEISKIYKISMLDLLHSNKGITEPLKKGQLVYFRPLEVFQETPLWKKFGPLAYKIGDQTGLNFWELRVWMLILWNESRFNPNPFGDADKGCSVGMGQVQVGGVYFVYPKCPNTGINNVCPSIPKKCPTDNRSLLPTNHPVYGDMSKQVAEKFRDPGVGITASAILFKQRTHQFVSPFDASAGYAGCVDAGKPVDLSKPGCIGNLMRLHKWWWDSGMAQAITKLETQKVASNP